MNAKEYSDKLLEFTNASMKWCCTEAEQGTERVTSAMEQLMQNIARVSAVSKDSVDALDRMRTMLRAAVNEQNLQQLHQNLSLLAKQNNEIDNFVTPIMQSLQFQDRLRQNLENMVKMIDVWRKQREAYPAKMSEADMQHFGNLLLKTTTMKRERDVIRDAIPGLEAEQEAESALFF